MSFCSFSEGAGMYGVTPIENIFLMEYLPAAPEGFLRVYLYARMLCLHPELGGELTDVARSLKMDEDAVFNAMSYWERQGLVQRLSDRPPTYAMLPVRSSGSAPAPMETSYYKYKKFNSSLQAIFGPQNLLHPKQYETAADWVEILGFEEDAVLRMVEAYLKRKRSRTPDLNRLFAELNKTALGWSERGVRTAEDVEKAMEFDERVDKTAQSVLKQFALRRQPTVDELNLVKKWLKEWGFGEEEIIAACAETTKSRTPTMAYLNSILENRRKGDGSFEAVKTVLKELGAREAQPTPDQKQSYEALLAAGFEPAVIRLAAVQCCRKGKNRFEDLEWMLGKWAEQKLFRADAAEAYLKAMNRTTAEVRALLEKCGSVRRPGMDDLTMYESWRADWSEDVIGYAAGCARGMQLPMRYIDRILGEWKKSGVTTVEEAKAQHEGHRAQTGTAGAPAAVRNPALNYEQRTHTEDDYAGLFINLDDEYGNGGDGA